jgi:hypothetical protein
MVSNSSNCGRHHATALDGHANILGIMIATDGNDFRSMGGGFLIFLLYGLFFWRLLKGKPGNRLVECGSLTLIVFLAMIPINSAGEIPDWLFGAWIILIVLLCFATLFFLLQRMIPTFSLGVRTTRHVRRDIPPSKMPKKNRSVWNFDADRISWPYAVIIPGVFLLSGVVGIIAGDFVRWGGVVLYTTFIFGFFISDSRRFFRQRRFWLLTTLLLGAHIAAFLAILLRIDEWKLLWFNVMILELPPLFMLRNLLLREIVGE